MRSLPLLLLALAACGDGRAPVPAPPPPPPAAAPPTKAKPPGEPDRVVVAHVLVSFKGAGVPGVTRTKEEAEALARELFKRIQGGEAFEPIRKRFSDDTGPGEYGMANHGVTPAAGERPRSGMVPAFGDVGFTLKPGEVAMAPYDRAKSPYGWHIILRKK